MPDDTEISLVFHPVNSTDSQGHSSCFAKAVGEVLAASDSEIRLVSPYLGGSVLRPLVEERSFRLVTDLDACFGAGANRDVVDLFSDRLEAVRHLPNVHAKVLFNNGAALLGSANLTVQGFAGRDELACLLRGHRLLGQLDAWFERLWDAAETVTSDSLEAAVACGASNSELRRQMQRPEGSTNTQRSRQTRTLGWMTETSDDVENPTSLSGREAMVSDSDKSELAKTLRKLTTNPRQARLVLELMAEALDIANLTLEDNRLHLLFDSKRPSIHVTVVQRYVVWGFPSSRNEALGFLLDDFELADTMAERLGEDGWTGRFRSPDTPSFKVKLEHLPQILPDIRPSWHRAIREEVERRTNTGRLRKSSFRKKKMPAFYGILTNPALRTEVVELTQERVT